MKTLYFYSLRNILQYQEPWQYKYSYIELGLPVVSFLEVYTAGELNCSPLCLIFFFINIFGRDLISDNPWLNDFGSYKAYVRVKRSWYCLKRAICLCKWLDCNGCRRICMNNWFATNCIVSNKIIVFLFHVVVKRQTSSLFFTRTKNRKQYFQRCLFVSVLYLNRCRVAGHVGWGNPDYLWLVLEPPFVLFIVNIDFHSSSQLFFRSLVEKDTNCCLSFSEWLHHIWLHQAESKHKQMRAKHAVRQSFKMPLWSKIHILFFFQSLKVRLLKIWLAKFWALIFIQRTFTLSASFGFHGPPLLTFKTDRLDLTGLDRGKSDVKCSLA